MCHGFPIGNEIQFNLYNSLYSAFRRKDGSCAEDLKVSYRFIFSRVASTSKISDKDDKSHGSRAWLRLTKCWTQTDYTDHYRHNSYTRSMSCYSIMHHIKLGYPQQSDIWTAAHPSILFANTWDQCNDQCFLYCCFLTLHAQCWWWNMVTYVCIFHHVAMLILCG